MEKLRTRARISAALMTAILLAALLFSMAPPARAASSQINDMDILCVVDEQGNAVITETIDIEAYEGTEYYQIANRMGDSEITSLQVSENGLPFWDMGEWDPKAASKTGKSGIRHTKDGCELCFGIGEYGHHVFEMTYTVENFVNQWEDACGVNYKFFSDLALPVSHARVTLEAPWELTPDNVRFWAFGFEGTLEMENGAVVIEAPEGVDKGMQLLLVFDDDPVFPNTNRAYDDWTFQKVYDDAVKGSSYSSGKGKGGSWLLWLFGGIFASVGLLIAGAVKLGDTDRYEDPDTARQIQKGNVYPYRDIPCGGDLVRFAYVLEDCKGNTADLKSTLISAYLLRWLQQGLISVSSGESRGRKNVQTYRIHLVNLPQFDEALERQLYEILRAAAGSDLILESSEFRRYCEHNDSQVNDWFKAYREQGRQRFLLDGFFREEQETAKFLLFFKRNRKVTVKTAAYLEEMARVRGFNSFLQAEDNMAEKSMIEVKLWDEYLVFAAAIGIADTVYQQVRVAVPQYADDFNHRYGYDPVYACAAARDFGDAGRSGLSAASESSSSGGGSTSSGGGGGGLR